MSLVEKCGVFYRKIVLLFYGVFKTTSPDFNVSELDGIGPFLGAFILDNESVSVDTSLRYENLVESMSQVRLLSLSG
jgi:hypothetical protein